MEYLLYLYCDRRKKKACKIVYCVGEFDSSQNNMQSSFAIKFSNQVFQ